MVSKFKNPSDDPRYNIVRGFMLDGLNGKQIAAKMEVSNGQISKLRKKWGLTNETLLTNVIDKDLQKIGNLEKEEPKIENLEIAKKKQCNVIPIDLLKDIKKIKAVMDQFGDKVRLSEVQSYLKEMNALKPSKEEEIKDSLRNLSATELANIIMPTNSEWIPQPALTTTMDKAELLSLIEESDV